MQKSSSPVSVFDLVESDLRPIAEGFGILLFCHLMIERLLEELLWCAGKQVGEDWEKELIGTSFHRKLGACQHRKISFEGQSTPIISGELRDALDYLNDLRNRTAHDYNRPLTFEEVHYYVALLGRAGVDFTDHIDADGATARELGYTDPFALLHEATKHLFSDLGYVLERAGGPDLVA